MRYLSRFSCLVLPALLLAIAPFAVCAQIAPNPDAPKPLVLPGWAAPAVIVPPGPERNPDELPQPEVVHVGSVLSTSLPGPLNEIVLPAETSALASSEELDKLRAEAVKASLVELRNYYENRGSYDRQAWQQRLDVFRWHHWSSILIFVVVVILIVTGVRIAFLEFRAGANEETTLKISKDGLEISSSVIGLIVLVVSLGFFYLYLTEVYPVKTIDDASTQPSPAGAVSDK